MIKKILILFYKLSFLFGYIPLDALLHSVPLRDVIYLAPIFDLLNSNNVFAYFLSIIILSYFCLLEIGWFVISILIIIILKLYSICLNDPFSLISFIFINYLLIS